MLLRSISTGSAILTQKGLCSNRTDNEFGEEFGIIQKFTDRIFISAKGLHILPEERSIITSIKSILMRKRCNLQSNSGIQVSRKV